MVEFIQALGDKVVVKLLASEEMTAGGLLAVSIPIEKSNKGLVVSIGEGTQLSDGSIKSLSVAIGDKVLFVPNAGISFSNGKENYRIMAARDILGKIVDGE